MSYLSDDVVEALPEGRLHSPPRVGVFVRVESIGEELPWNDVSHIFRLEL